MCAGRRRPSDGEGKAEEGAGEEETGGHTLRQALATPAFWVFGLSSAVYGLIASGIALFNESILAERGFDASVYYRSLVVVALTSLAGNFLGGWLASKWRMNRLLALALALLVGSLLASSSSSSSASGAWRTGAGTWAGYRARRRR